MIPQSYNEATYGAASDTNPYGDDGNKKGSKKSGKPAAKAATKGKGPKVPADDPLPPLAPVAAGAKKMTKHI